MELSCLQIMLRGVQNYFYPLDGLLEKASGHTPADILSRNVA